MRYLEAKTRRFLSQACCHCAACLQLMNKSSIAAKAVIAIIVNYGGMGILACAGSIAGCKLKDMSAYRRLTIMRAIMDTQI